MATGTERRTYTPEFKAAAVERHRGGQSIDDVAAALDVPEPLVRTWVLQDDMVYAGKPRPAPITAPVSAPVAAAQPAPMKHCIVCGRGPALDAKLRTVTGIVVAFRMRSITGTFCRDCGIAMARRTLDRTLVSGWWGLFAGVANWYAAAVDAGALGRFRRSPAPVGEPTAPPLKPGGSVFRRAGVYVGSVVMIAGFLFGLAVVGSQADPSALNGKCVAFSQTRIVAKPSCSQTHDGRVVGVVANRAFCPEATDATMRLKANASKLLCLDLDQ